MVKGYARNKVARGNAGQLGLLRAINDKMIRIRFGGSKDCERGRVRGGAHGERA